MGEVVTGWERKTEAETAKSSGREADRKTEISPEGGMVLEESHHGGTCGGHKLENVSQD